MGIVSKIRDGLGLKAIDQVKHQASTGLLYSNATPERSAMQRDIGTGLNANVLLSPIGWLQRNAAEAVPSIRNVVTDEVVLDHPLLALLDQPNPFYTGAHLLAASIFSLATDGNAYWQIESGMGGRPTALYYTPHWLIKPKWPDDGSEFITHYEYSPGGGPAQRLEIEDVLHFKLGINPENSRLGLSPLSGLLAEIWSDMEAGGFVGAILKNGGVPSMLFSPRGEDNSFDSDEVASFKDYLKTMFSGSRRGDPLVSSVDARLEQFGFNPQELDLSSVRNVAEERVCAALGIPAAVVGFGTGMEQTKVGATMRELRKEAWQGGVLPILGSMAQEINRSLVTQFGTSSQRLKMFYDASQVAALSEGRDEVEARVMKRVEAGVTTVNEGRLELGLEEAVGQDVYLRPFSTIEVPQGSAGRTIEAEGKQNPDVLLMQRGPAEWDRKLHATDADLAVQDRHEEFDRPAKRPKQFDAWADRNDAIVKQSTGSFEDDLAKFFDDLGKAAAIEARRVLSKSGPLSETKDLEDQLAEQIVAGLNMAERIPIFEELFEVSYLKVATQTSEAMEATIGLAIGVPDPAARAILAAGGKRAGLLGIADQAKQSIFDGLVQAAATGPGPRGAAEMIRTHVTIGPRFGKAAVNFRELISQIPPHKRALSYALRDPRFDSEILSAIQSGQQLSGAQVEKMFEQYADRAVRYRSNMIAKTEMRFASNVSTLEMGKAIGATEALVYDNRGAGEGDDDCIGWDGKVVTLDLAQSLMVAEHPNGTRSFTPIPPTMKL